MLDEDLVNRFTHHPPAQGQDVTYDAVRMAGLGLGRLLNAACPDSTELRFAIRNLEQAVFWANAAIARNPQNATAQEGADDGQTQ